MFRTACRLLAGGMLFVGLLTLPGRAEVGGVYTVFGFRPYLERGYNTRLGWQGWPITTEDPHLYLYSADNLRLLTEMEYLRADGRIHTQIFKVYQPTGNLGPQEWDELEYFALEASHNRLGSQELHAMVQHNCQGEWYLNSVYVTLIAEPSATWLRVSEHTASHAKPWADCLAKKTISHPN